MKHVGMSQSATPATQNDMTACFETFNKDGFCSFPHRHCDGTIEASDSRRDMLEQQNEHFVRDFLKFHTLQLQNRRFPTIFPTNRPQNRRFVRGFRRFSSPVKNATPATEFAPCHHFVTMRFTKNTQHATSKVLRLPRKIEIRGVQSAAPATKNATHLLKTWQKYCACHTKRFLTRLETCWNATKCHACHAK